MPLMFNSNINSVVAKINNQAYPPELKKQMYCNPIYRSCCIIADTNWPKVSMENFNHILQQRNAYDTEPKILVFC